MKSSNIVLSARRGIIWIGKYAPFLFVAIVTLSNLEALFSIVFDRYVEYDGFVIYYKPISWWIGERFELSIAWIVSLAVLSIGVEACIWNRACIAFLALILWQKNFFLEHTIDETIFSILLSANCIVGIFLVVKGVWVIKLKRFC